MPEKGRESHCCREKPGARTPVFGSCRILRGHFIRPLCLPLFTFPGRGGSNICSSKELFKRKHTKLEIPCLPSLNLPGVCSGQRQAAGPRELVLCVGLRPHPCPGGGGCTDFIYTCISFIPDPLVLPLTPICGCFHVHLLMRKLRLRGNVRQLEKSSHPEPKFRFAGSSPHLTLGKRTCL